MIVTLSDRIQARQAHQSAVLAKNERILNSRESIETVAEREGVSSRYIMLLLKANLK